MSKQRNSFLEQAVDGLVQLEDVDDFIDRWHEEPRDVSLHVYLGMTAEEYAEWVRFPDMLNLIVERRREKPLARISERELIVPALQIAASYERGEVSTSDLVTRLMHLFKPSGEDDEILQNRNDTKFSQKVRNLVSHRSGASTMFGKGYAEYTGDGLRITEKGRAFLESVPEFIMEKV